MHGKTGRRRNRWTAGAAALLVHALIIEGLLRLPAPSPQPAVLERMILLNLQPSERAIAGAVTVREPVISHRRPRPAPAQTTRIPGDAASTAPPASAESPSSIDWAAEQQRMAASKGEEIWRQLSQHCREAAALHIHPPECHRYVAPAPWEPEHKQFGLEGPLPYVRLGRCVVGLGFWGCAVGKPLQSNGHALDGMHDPDRPGAIPDNGMYQQPAKAREPLH